MRRLFIFLVLFTTMGNAQAPACSWIRTAVSSKFTNSWAVNCDHSGNVIHTINYEGNLSLSTQTLAGTYGNGDIAVTKYNAFGQLLWVQKIGGGGYEYSWGNIGFDNQNNIFISGGTNSSSLVIGSTTVSSPATGYQLFLVALSGNGNLLWVKFVQSTNDISGGATAVDASGNIYVTGALAGSAIFASDTITSNAYYDCLLLKFDHSGNPVWARSAGGAGTEHTRTIMVDNAGDIYITGMFRQPINLGNDTLVSHGFDDVFFLKYNNNGQLLYGRNFGGDFNEYSYTIGVDALNNVYLNGCYQGHYVVAGYDTIFPPANHGDEIFFVKYDASGNEVWLKTFGGPGNDWPFGIFTNPAGDSYLAGCFNGINCTFGNHTLQNAQNLATRNGEVYLVKCDVNGNALWAKGTYLPANQYGMAVTADALDNVYVEGGFEVQTGMGCIATTSVSAEYDLDVFLMKFNGENGDLAELPENKSNSSPLLFPNPAHDYMEISGEQEEFKKGHITLLNSLGQTIYSQSFELGNSGRIPLLVPPGVYLAEITVNGKRHIEKILVE